MLMVFGVIVLLAGVALSLPRSFKPEVRCTQGPTASKVQSKLWFNDGLWWGILFDGSSEEYHIYRYDQTENSWRDTGVLVDARNTSRADALWEDGHLYVVSAGTEASLEKDSAQFLRYRYDPSTERYSLDKGFPATITEGGMEAIAVAKDTTGKLWATYTQGDDLRRVFVTHTSGKGDSSWVKPFVLPLRGTTVSSDDVSGIVAFGSKIGLMWSNQYDESGMSGFYFATHSDGEPEEAWRLDKRIRGAGMANDHINLKADSEGRVFATLKTRRDRIDRDPDAPYSMLWVRDKDGSWTGHVFGTVEDSHTRSLALVDEEQNMLYMFASSPSCTGGKVYYKRTDLDDISFEEGRGILFIEGPEGTNVGDATSTKQSLDEASGALVVASDKNRGYYYNLIDLRDQEKQFPDGARIRTDTAPSGTPEPGPIIFEVGPIALSYHGLLIALGIAVGTWIAGRELARRGYDGALALGSLFFVVPLGVLGGRLCHVATEYHRYTRNPFPKVLETYDGGLGIYGAVAGGFLGLLLFSWYRGINALTFADAAAPGLVLGQAIGRWGNYFNQELFGQPSDLPWAIRIAPLNRPTEYADATSFHPAFLYESLWDVLVCLVLLWVARRFSKHLKNGDVFLLYVSLYSVGRFLVETLRIDEAFVVGASIRGNLFLSGVLAVGFALVLVLRHLRALPNRSEPG